ncbi:MAG: cell division protein SepF [Candidatus Saganbacteria bacterium]|nr:cell division protein SepF [Candidatus Saganbacteria bacterium]
MVGNLFKRAKEFIGLEGEEEEGKQMEMSTVLRNRKANPEEGEYEIILYEPRVYEDSLSISAKLRAGSPVIINLKSLEPAEGTRLIDFVCGTAYAIDGHMVKIGESIFLFTPNNILINDIEGHAVLEEESGARDNSRDKFFRGR